LGVLFLKLSLYKLLTKYKYDYMSAESLVEEIGDITSTVQDSKIQGLEDCKKVVARDVCRLAIRKGLTAQDSAHAGMYVRRVYNLFRSGVEPESLPEKIIFREITHIHFAHVQRISGLTDEAIGTIRPFMARCCSMAQGTSDRAAAGLQWLAVSLLAMGEVHDACSLMAYVYPSFGWLCDLCGRRAYSPTSASICRHCFDFLCESCLAALKDDPNRSGFCVPGHHLIALPPKTTVSMDGNCVFRERVIPISECVGIIQAEWASVESLG
jgi:hypothetical protein